MPCYLPVKDMQTVFECNHTTYHHACTYAYEYTPTAHPHREACANGLAFDRETQKLYITGKMWSSLYHIELPVARLAKEESK